uniref:Regulatory protein zeste n=1 Tax=Phlebotomus papatasi TaxID=29031 RepID=A0A1B0EVV1_PHLPP
MAMRLWQQVTTELNAIPGAKKDALQWRRCWHDLKKNTRTKAAGDRKYRGGTGGGPPKIILTENEEALSQLLCEVEVRGNPYIKEQGITFEDSFEENSGDKLYIYTVIQLAINVNVFRVRSGIGGGYDCHMGAIYTAHHTRKTVFLEKGSSSLIKFFNASWKFDDFLCEA